MAAGEVLFTTQIGTAGTGGNVLGNLIDGNSFTYWQTAGGGYAGVNCGTAARLTRVRWSPLGGWEDASLAAVIQGSSSNNFTFGYQGKGAHNFGGSSATVSATFPHANIAGHCLVVFVFGSTGVTFNTPTDTALNTYTLVQSNASLLGQQQACWISPNCAANASNTVTATMSGNAFPYILIAELPDVALSSPLDVISTNSSSSGTGNPVTATTGTVTTTAANDLIITLWVAGGGTGPTLYTATPGCALIAQEGPNFPIVTVAQTGTAGAYTENALIYGGQNEWWAFTITLKTIASPANLYIITNRSVAGTLLNEVDLNPASTFQYYAYISVDGNPGNIGDLDFIGQYTAGVTAQAIDPVISPPGGQYDQPIVVTMSSLTTDAVIHYTTNGSTPTGSSPTYSGPIVISATANLQAIAISSGLSNSRVKAAQFYIPATQISTALWYPDNRGYPIWAVNPQFYLDPVSGYWYLYGQNLDQPGVYVTGNMGVNVYRSADLRNWTYRYTFLQPAFGQALGLASIYFGRCAPILYNKANNNYILWAGDSAGGGERDVYQASTPEGPWTLLASYTTLNGFGCTGDHTVFLDTDGVSAYICYQQFQNNISFYKLSADFKTVTATGSNYAMPVSGGVWGGYVEAPHMFKRGSTYFLVMSGTTNWAPDTNLYWTSSSPTGPWGPNGGLNPFVVVPNSPYSAYKDVTIAYNTQNMGAVIIPGRDDGSTGGAWFYTGDAYNTGLSSSTITSPTANFEAYTYVTMPVSFPASTSMSVTYNNAWTFDGAFPSTRRPGIPSSFGWTGTQFTWSNSELGPVCMYLDFANDPNFNTVVRSEFIGQSNSISTYSPIVPHSQAGFYRLRVVNASGTSFSQPAIAAFQNWNAFGIKPVNSKNIQHLQTINSVTVNSGTVSSAQATLTNIVSNDIICIRISWQSPSGSVLSVSGSLNGSYLPVPGSLQSYYGQTTAWYYLPSSGAGADTITATLSGSLPKVVIEATELSPWEVYTATGHGPNSPPIIAPYNPGGPKWNNLNVIQDYIDKFNSQNIYLLLPHP